MGVDNEEDEEEIEKAKQKQKKKAAEDKEITNGRIVLRNALHPKLPNAGDYLLDPWEEKRRNEWVSGNGSREAHGPTHPATDAQGALRPLCGWRSPGLGETPARDCLGPRAVHVGADVLAILPAAGAGALKSGLLCRVALWHLIGTRFHMLSSRSSS